MYQYSYLFSVGTVVKMEVKSCVNCSVWYICSKTGDFICASSIVNQAHSSWTLPWTWGDFAVIISCLSPDMGVVKDPSELSQLFGIEDIPGKMQLSA